MGPQRRKSRRRRNDEGAIQTPMVKEESGLVSIRAENIEHVRAGPGGREQRKAKRNVADAHVQQITTPLRSVRPMELVFSRFNSRRIQIDFYSIQSDVLP